MTLRFKTLKPGSLIISKRYNVFKRLWCKLLKKELPYNTITLFTNTTSIFDIYREDSPEILMELKKDYTKEELKHLTSLIEECTEQRDITAISFKKKKDKEQLAVILNLIRPRSINLDLNAEQFKNILYKNYYVKRLAEEKKWDICVY